MSYWDRWATWLEATEQREAYWDRYWRDLAGVLADRRAKGLRIHPGPYKGPVDYSLI